MGKTSTCTYTYTRARSKSSRKPKRPSMASRGTGTGKGQDISRPYISPSKLEILLDTKFGGEYRVVLRQDKFTVFARRQLSEQEIRSCA